MVVRKVVLGDAPYLSEIHRRCFEPNFMSTAMFAQLAALWPETCVVEWEGEPAGYALAVVDSGMVWLPNVAVRPDLHRKGLGGRLLRQVMKNAKGNGLEAARLYTLTTNRSVHLYQREGFVVVDQGALLQDGQDRYLMECRFVR